MRIIIITGLPAPLCFADVSQGRHFFIRGDFYLIRLCHNGIKKGREYMKRKRGESMKKTAVICFIAVIICLLTGCQITSESPSKNDLIVIPDTADTVYITHFSCEGIKEWTAEGEDAARLRTWVKGLSYKPIAFEEGHTPGDADGGEVYIFSFTSEIDNGAFSYHIGGPKNCYLFAGNDWYIVQNPADPPVDMPE